MPRLTPSFNLLESSIKSFTKNVEPKQNSSHEIIEQTNKYTSSLLFSVTII